MANNATEATEATLESLKTLQYLLDQRQSIEEIISLLKRNAYPEVPVEQPVWTPSTTVDHAPEFRFIVDETHICTIDDPNLVEDIRKLVLSYYQQRASMSNMLLGLAEKAVEKVLKNFVSKIE